MSAWIRDGKVWKIVTSLSETKLKRLIKTHEQRGWKMVGEIKPHGQGYGCLMTTGGLKRSGSS